MGAVTEQGKPIQKMTAEKWLQIIHQQTIDAATKPPSTPAEIAQGLKEGWDACGFATTINEKQQVVPTRWPKQDEAPVLSPSAPHLNQFALKITNRACASDKEFSEMHTGYQSRSPFRRSKEIKKDTEKRKPRHKPGKKEIIERFQKQQKLL